MFTTSKSVVRPLPQLGKGRRLSLLERVVRWNAAYREKQSFSNLDEDSRRDMGLENEKTITVAEILAR